MRVVIDSNCVQTSELDRFLTASPSNRAVVTDMLMMEAYKGDTLRSLPKSLGVLAKHPRQVIVLQNAGMCMRRAVGPQMANRLIWKEHTETFPEFVRQVASGAANEEGLPEPMAERGVLANERMQLLLDMAPSLQEGQRLMLQSLTPEDIDAIRGRRHAPPEILRRVFGIALALAEELRQSLRPNRPLAVGRDLTSEFLFRVGLAMTSWFLEWVRTGSSLNAKSQKVRNDHVDTMLSVYGTYFNGVMTRDAKLLNTHSLNRALLEAAGAQLPSLYRQDP